MSRIREKMGRKDYLDWRTNLSNCGPGSGKTVKRVWLVWIDFIIRENSTQRYSRYY